MSSTDSQLGLHYEVLVGLARSESWVRGDLGSTLREVAEAAARTMGIERVNVWLFDAERTRMRCIEHYDRSSGEHSAGGLELAAADYPAYFRALSEERTIVADDARTDPRTREFAEGYLDVHGITSMLDAPLRSSGDVVGIICHEHVGPARTWSAEEQRLAGSLADIASLALETAERKQAEGALRRSEELTREIITHALDAIVIADAEGVILDWNPRAESIFGWKHGEAVGKTLYETVIPSRYHDGHRRGMEHFLATGEGPIVNDRIEMHARSKQGDEFPVELTVSPVRIGDGLAFSAFIRDITDRVRAELEVHKLNAELEERVRERTNQLRTAVHAKERLLEELQASSLELVARLRELERKSAVIRNDLERAQVIQRALLPARPPNLEGVRVDALYRPGMHVGGDLYDVALLDDGRVALYVADAAGHGVAAAMLSVLFKQRLRMRDEQGAALDPPEVLRQANARLSRDVRAEGLFLTAGYVLLDPRTGELRVASAGHTPIVLRRANGESALLERTGPALGLVADAAFSEHRLVLEPGDRLCLYTDGLIDALRSHDPGEILDLLGPALTGDASRTSDRLTDLFQDVDRRARSHDHEGGRDDVTLLVLEAGGGRSSFDNEPAEEPPEGPRGHGDGTETPSVLWIAEGPDTTYLAVRGRGLWTCTESFRRSAHAAREAGKRLVVDLADCTHLDSAFLGTLHEVVATAPEGRVSVRRPCASVRALFAELGLERVLAAVDERAAEPPCAPTPLPHDPPGQECQERLLRAHEVLCELSEENRERFASLVQTLRAELGE